jgi:hypothetical protein
MSHFFMVIIRSTSVYLEVIQICFESLTIVGVFDLHDVKKKSHLLKDEVEV